MIEQRQSSLLFPARQESDVLRERVSRQRQQRRDYTQSVQSIRQHATLLLNSPVDTARSLPSRYWLHFVIALVMPVSIVLSALPVHQQQGVVEAQALSSFADLPLGLGPIALEGTNEFPLVGDAPLGDDEAFPMPISLASRSEMIAPLVVDAQVSGESARLRTGPGLDYDEVGKLEANTPLQVVGRFGDWFQVRQGESGQIHWMAGELINLPEAAAFSLNEVPAELIAPPPPPKVGHVLEEGLNLRDGPGTNYVGMIKLDAGAQLSLLEQYQDWLHVATNDNRDGWVKAEFLSVVDGVIQRVPVTENIPDPNPAMVGWVRENGVNLRKGPGSAYATVGKVGDMQVSLVARHKDWYKVKTPNGTVAWIFSDLLDIAPMVKRRVAVTNDIPALPVAPRITTRAGSGGSSGGSSAAYAIPASGDVASYAVQFVGHRYRWGGSSPAGFDCSGLTSYVYRQFGVRLPHSSAGQFNSAYGAIINNMGSLAPGDLMFFVNTGARGISHVAIYIGGGRMVHAMTPRLGVQVSNIHEAYWVNHFYGGLRPYR